MVFEEMVKTKIDDGERFIPKEHTVFHEQGVLSEENWQLPPSINYHLTKACNYNCKFCFARFNSSNFALSLKKISGFSQCTLTKAL